MLLKNYGVLFTYAFHIIKLSISCPPLTPISHTRYITDIGIVYVTMTLYIRHFACSYVVLTVATDLIFAHLLTLSHESSLG